MRWKEMLSNLSKRTAVLLLTILLAVIGCAAAFAAGGRNAVYTTAGGTWTQVDENTWTMTQNGKNITLIKNGDTWQYLFEVDDPDATYYGWEEVVPEGYEIPDGKGTRADPIVINKKARQVSHTPNISAAGVQNGNYANNLDTMDVVKIPGASSLHVTITYGGESTSYDWACMWQGDVSGSYTAKDNYSSSVTKKLGGTKKTGEWDVDGDTVTFGFHSDSSAGGYGYYAVVTAKNELEDEVITNRTTKIDPETDYGALKLSKTVTGTGADKSQNFQFHITLSAETEELKSLLLGSHTYGEVPFRDGKGLVYLKDGGTVSMTDIPAGVTWTITETGSEGYVTSFTGGDAVDGQENTCTGTIAKEQTGEVVYTNHKDDEPGPGPDPGPVPGSFTVAKKVENGSGQDSFAFSAVLWNLTAGETYSVTITRTDGTAETKTYLAGSSGIGYLEFDLRDGEKAEFTGVPVNAQYQISEEASEGYTASYEITGEGVSAVMSKKENSVENQELATAKETLEQDEKATVTFTNSKPEPNPDMVDIPVTKIWSDNNNAAGQRPESITVRLLQDGDIIATALLDESSQWRTVFEHLDRYHDDGSTPYVYAIEEEPVQGYTSQVEKAEGTEDGYTVTNTFSDARTGDLKLSKTVSGTDADLTKNFRFTVKLTKDEKPVSGTFQLDSEKGSKTGTVFFDEDGQAVISLKDGESAYIMGLPDGASYTVTETAYADWKSSLEDGNSGTGTISETLSEVAVKNTYVAKADLSVGKTVSGSMGNKNKEFHFELKLTGDHVPESLESSKNGTDSTITGTNGVFEFTLAHGETIRFKDIPLGLGYEVSETDGKSDGYTVTTDTAPVGTLSEDVEVNFTNNKNGSIPTLAYMNLMVPFIMILSAAGIIGYVFRRKNKSDQK